MNNQQDDNKDLADALRGYGLKQRIAELHREIVPKLENNNPAKVINMRSLFMRAAAILVAMVTLATAYIYLTSTSENLFNDKYVAYNISPQRSGDSVQNGEMIKIFGEGQAALKNNDTKLAIQSFSSILANRNDILHDDSEYYLALSWLKAGNADLAYKRFREINKNESHLYHDEVSNWFLFKLKLLSWKNK